MKDNFRFKVRGLDTLMTIDELMKAETTVSQRCVKVIDMQTKQTWIADYRTVRSKFR
jgi:hypothetical protein